MRPASRAPREPGHLSVRRDHEEVRVFFFVDDIGPILKRRRKAVEKLAGSWQKEPAETVGDRLTMLIAVYARLGSNDVVGRMRLQRSVMIRHQHTVVRDEVE